MNTHNTQEEKTIRLSLFWIIIGLVGITALSILGGAFGQQFINPPLPPLNNTTEKLVTTVQEVTLSPNIAASKVVKENERSVLAIATVSASAEPTMVATGLVITSDGLVVTPNRIKDLPVVALDHEGRSHDLTLVGSDNIFGLSYWRLEEGVFVPLEIRHENSPVATDLLVITRSSTTFLNKVDTYKIREYALPTAANPIGVQKVVKGNSFDQNVLEGSPLVDDEGKISALLTNSELGLALPATTIRESLDRVINKEHEINPVATTGMTPTYSFKKQSDEEGRAFTVTISAIAPNSPAAIAGVKAGDTVISIDEEVVTWDSSFIKSISKPLPFKITVEREGEEETYTLIKAAE